MNDQDQREMLTYFRSQEPPEGMGCKWRMQIEEHVPCPNLATMKSGLGPLIGWLCDEHGALQIPSHNERWLA